MVIDPGNGPGGRPAPDPATPALGPLLQPVSPLALQVRRATGEVVGRPSELDAIEQELSATAGGRLSALTVEGEPGIGKTRLLVAASEIAAAQGFTTVAVAADEEIRGPFLLARSIVGSPEGSSAAAGTAAEDPLRRSAEALSGRGEAGMESLPPDQKLLRTLDLGAMAVRELAAVRPLAILIDDLQWADDDSLRLLRYIVRADVTSPIFLMLAVRPEEMAFVTEGVNLIADMERVGIVRRLRLGRFTQAQSAELLQQSLGGRVEPTGAATMHAQAEGVPFIVEELVRAYRDASLLQEVDGVWTLAKNAERLVPSAVRTLISRRAARVPEETKAVLAEAAVLGRHFSLKDLQALEVQLGEGERSPEDLDEALLPAVRAGLLVQHPQGSAADYGFAHEQVREFAAGALPPARRRAIHSAIVDLLLVGEPAPEALPLLAHHAKAAGNAEVCVRFSLQASRNALAASAPEEVLRVVEVALPTAPAPQDRLALLQARDQALDMLRRPSDRLQGLAEMAALADALGEWGLEIDVQLRRAAALRQSDERDQAAELARRAQERAAEQGDRALELAATLELGQDLLGMPLGESFSPPVDAHTDAAEEAFTRALDVAEELGDLASQAAASRELGIIEWARIRTWFTEQVAAGAHMEFVRLIAQGMSIDELIPATPAGPGFERARRRLERSLELFEELNDRRGAMSAVIALAHVNWGPDIHLGSGAGRHIEEIRRLSSRMTSMAKESERAVAEGQMLYGSHVFSRAKLVPDLAISKGEEAYRQAKLMGDRSLEFLAAGGTALAQLDIGDLEQAERWLGRAAAVASESPTPLRARQLEMWRGRVRAAAGDADGMREHLQRAVALATEQGRPAARCEALAALITEAARLGLAEGRDDLLALAEETAAEVKSLSNGLPGRPLWGAQADAALASIALRRGDRERALELARAAAFAYQASLQEDAHLELLVPAAEVFVEAGSEGERELARTFLQATLAMTAQRTVDEDVRVRWLRSPAARELVRLAGSIEGLALEPGNGDGSGLGEDDAKLLALLTEGLTNREIAERLGVEDETVSRRLAELLARIGASSRAEATAFAFRERVV